MITEQQIGDTENENIKGATLTGQLNGAPFTDQIILYRYRDHWRYRWFVSLGPSKT